MYKVLFSSLLLLSATAQADNTPTFDFKTGWLEMPFVSTNQGNFTASLQLIPNLQDVFFTIKAVNTTSLASDTVTPPTFDFGTGILKLPLINTDNGNFTATLKFENNAFSLTEVKAVVPVPPPSTVSIGGCSIFPSNNAWNTPIDKLPLHSRSAAWINSISTTPIRTDFGADFGAGPFGQPYNLVSASKVPLYTLKFEFPIESDAGPYPIPDNFLREATDDRRLFIIDKETCKLYEMYNAEKAGSQWSARRGAIWDMNSNALRPLGFGSADEGGFPILPGLVRYEEVITGAIKHALRFTLPKPNTYIWPARHVVGANLSVNNTLPMGARLRLKASVNISNYAPELKVILQAMKTYGIMLVDDGSATGMFLSGTPDDRWSNDSLVNLRNLKGSDFEAVNSECMMVNADSGEANLNKCK